MLGQMNVKIDDDTRLKAVAIAKIRNERDLIGHGISVIIRRSIKSYVKRYEHVLPDNWHDQT